MPDLRDPDPVLRPATALLSGLLLVLAAGPLAAQAEAGFLFERPTFHVDLHGGLALPRAESQIFDFTRERLTVDDADLRSVALGAGLGYRATERVDLAVELGFSRAGTRSEFRDWEDATGRPIVQTTRFTRFPVTLTVRGYLWDRGRSVGRFAWVPRSWTPYLGVGAGFVGYAFEQEGDFVDFETLEIFRERFRSTGTAPTAHVLAGTDVSLGPRFVLTGEARYSWARAPMDREFEGFDDIDLTGLRTTLGLSIRF